MRKILNFLLLITITINAQTTTWDGTSWNNGIPTSAIDAVFTGNFTSTGDIAAKSVVINNNSTVSISSGDTFTIQDNIDVNVGSSFIFENTASLLQINPSATNTGNITYRRDSTPIRQFEYTYWSSPVIGQTLVSFSPLTASDRYYSFDNINNIWQTENPNNTMQSGRGYAIRVPNNYTSTPQIYNGEFKGTPNNGNISASVVTYNPVLLNYSLIGNPYPSAISVTSLIDNSTLGTLYFWTHNTAINSGLFSTTDYAIRTRNSGTAAISGGAIPSAYIASGQGFFASSNTTGNITFTNNMRVSTNNSQFFKSTQADPLFYYYWLNMTNTGGAFKQISIGYEQGATNGYDFGVDAAPSPGTYITFYSMIDAGTYAIQGRAYPWNQVDIIPLGYNCTIADTFQITLDHNDAFFADKDIFIEDTDNNTFHNLKTGPYSFTSTIGTFNNRFKIRYTNPSLGTQNQSVNPSTIYVYKEENNLVVSSSVEEINSIVAYDILGRNIFEKENINSNKFALHLSSNENQTILVKIKLKNNQTITKKIIL